MRAIVVPALVSLLPSFSLANKLAEEDRIELMRGQEAFGV